MAKGYFVVHSNPVEGRDDEYNDWYTNRHIADVIAVPGFVSGQRFVATEGQESYGDYKYLALYEIDGDIDATIAALDKAVDEGMFLSPALDPKVTAYTFEAISDRITP